MFSPAAMIRLTALVLARDERAVLHCLGKMGVLELTRAAPDTARPGTRDEPRKMAECDQLSARVIALRKSLDLSAAGELPPADTLPLARAGEKLRAMEERAQVLLENRRRLRERHSMLMEDGEKFSAYCGLDLPLDGQDSFAFLHFITGTLPEGAFATLEPGAQTALLPLPGQNGRQPLLAVTTRARRAALEVTLHRAGFKPENLPVAAGATPEILSEQGRRERERIGTELAQLDDQLRLLGAEFAGPLAVIENSAALERNLLAAAENFSRTESAVLLTGWVPDADSAGLKRRIRDITGGRCVIETAPPEMFPDAEVPVHLRHPRWLRPFGSLVSAFGLPRYHELEPTLFFAASFVLMFGMMFGDVGHGAVLALAGAGALRAGRTLKLRDTGVLLLASGVSSAIFGLLYGSCFGLPAFKKFALWHDPLEGDPMSLMFAAIGAGVVMISLGLVLNVINRFRRGDFLGGWLGHFGVAGLVFYWGALALLAKLPAIKSLNLLAPAVVVLLVLPVAGWVLKDPLEFFRNRHSGRPAESGESLFAAVTESLVGAFEAILSFLANTISFVRLAAYAMSHAALLVAAFLMADAVKHLPAAGTFLCVAVIVLGNVVAIVLEGVIATVQALRLEYYEFFSKFFSGAGRPFKPFRLQTKTVADTPL
jgi:V/A-type H+-transporting ATPase subunit I